MKNTLIFLICLGFAARRLEAQQRPGQYFTSTLSHYECRGITLEKGDQLHFKVGQTGDGKRNSTL